MKDKPAKVKHSRKRKLPPAEDEPQRKAARKVHKRTGSRAKKRLSPYEIYLQKEEEARIDAILKQVELEHNGYGFVKRDEVVEDITQLLSPKYVQQVAVGEGGQLLHVPDFIREEVLYPNEEKIENNNNVDKICCKVLNYNNNKFYDNTNNNNVFDSLNTIPSNNKHELDTETIIESAEYLLSVYEEIKKHGIVGFPNTHFHTDISENNNDSNFKNITDKSFTIPKIDNDCKPLNTSFSKPAVPKNSSINKEKYQSTNANSNVVIKHYNKIKERNLDDRNKSTILNLRNFNNWVKSMLISRNMSSIKKAKHRLLRKSKISKKRHRYEQRERDRIKVLDMCCGKGGDLLKWKKANISRLICVDISESSVEECKRRYKRMGSEKHGPPFRAEFIVHDCTQAGLSEKFRHPDIRLDLVNCQFALHYSFESQKQAENMLENVSKNLRPGGYFIGTIPNENELRSRSHSSQGHKFGNDIYQIEFLFDKNNPPPYGAKYNFFLKDVVDCPEFLVDLSLLRELASKYNLELVKFQSFERFYEEMIKRDRHLFRKLDLFPPYFKVANNREPDKRNCTNTRNSTHNHINRNLSQAEWDVITLYSIFVFRKR